MQYTLNDLATFEPQKLLGYIFFTFSFKLTTTATKEYLRVQQLFCNKPSFLFIVGPSYKYVIFI